MNGIGVVVLALFALAFAPAPFPRPVRHDAPNDLKILQGAWTRTDDTFLRVTDDIVRFPSTDDNWRFTLNPKANPKHITFHNLETPGLVYQGIYRIEGDTWTYRIRESNSEFDRPKDFDTPDPKALLRVNRRKKD